MHVLNHPHPPSGHLLPPAGEGQIRGCGNTILTILTHPHDNQELLSWREYPHSLTDRLCAAKGSIHLDLLRQKWTPSNWWDKYLLNITDPRNFKREILMKHQDITYWYARTIIPETCYYSDTTLFTRLETESIKNLIFDNPDVHRVQLIHYPIDKHCIEFQWASHYFSAHQTRLWARLAQYSLKNSSLFYLLEILSSELGDVL